LIINSFLEGSKYVVSSEKGLHWLNPFCEGVAVIDDIEKYDYGKFVHIMDPDGNKIELWEPVDEVFDAGVKGRTK
jgi:hypothetical protein